MFKKSRCKVPMNLQLFAEGGDGAGADGGNGGGSGEGAGGEGGAGGDIPPSFDDFLKTGGNQAEFDRRVQKAVNTAVTKAQEKWQALADDKLSEAEKLAKMTKEEKESILLPVCYEKAVVKDKKASVVFTYANGDTYTGFNSAEIQNAGGSKLYTSQLGSSTMALSGDFVTSDGQKHISNEDLMKKTDYCLVYADYPVTVFGEHDIAYVSPNVTVLASNCAQITGNDGGYIIFK